MKALILAGGTGTRLWPISREKKPKQFHAFASDRTLLQMTYDRLDFLKSTDIFISVSAPYAAEIIKQLPKVTKNHIFIEPETRDTGPAIAYAAHELAKKFPSEVMAVIYADQMVQNKDEFRKKLLTAETTARKYHTLNIIEVKAKTANPNLGYVKIGRLREVHPDGTEIYELDRFVEKPDIETAKKYTMSLKYLWNTGIYVWEVKTILEKFKKYAPDIYSCVTAEKNEYAACPKISIDYCLMEKVNPREVRIIPAELGWSDVGTWSSLFDELVSDPQSNFVQGEHIGQGTAGSVIMSTGEKLIVTSGIKDIVIIDTQDALLVMPKDKAADVKKIVAELRKRKKEKYL